MLEIWKEIEGTKGFIEVSNMGRVRSLLRGTPYVLKTQPDTKGYHRIRVTVEREKMCFKVHREVAKAFVPNPYNLPQVNHIDGNKDNNAVTNLEWVSNKENSHHAIKNGLWKAVFDAAMKENEKRKIPIIAYTDSVEIAFKSISEAEKVIGTSHIADVLKGKRIQAKGYKFRYAKGGDDNTYSNC